ncbi:MULTISPECIES: transcriptional regulator [Rosenbergiella]|uniref:transcriptional regulator n=1 Tax=Rosenbergiella TaxID=1356488 RepID=UPI001F4F2598|nr:MULTISPECIES: transcriptional regulator [Rosenbergiella]
MTGFELRLWRRGCNWTQDRAALYFGISLRTYQVYEKMPGDIPQLAERATRELQLRQMLPELKKLSKEHVIARLEALLNISSQD